MNIPFGLDYQIDCGKLQNIDKNFGFDQWISFSNCFEIECQLIMPNSAKLLTESPLCQSYCYNSQ